MLETSVTQVVEGTGSRRQSISAVLSHERGMTSVRSLEPGLSSAHDVPACAGSASASARRLAASTAMIQSDPLVDATRRSGARMCKFRIGTGALTADYPRACLPPGHLEGLPGAVRCSARPLPPTLAHAH